MFRSDALLIQIPKFGLSISLEWLDGASATDEYV